MHDIASIVLDWMYAAPTLLHLLLAVALGLVAWRCGEQHRTRDFFAGTAMLWIAAALVAFVWQRFDDPGDGLVTAAALAAGWTLLLMAPYAFAMGLWVHAGQRLHALLVPAALLFVVQVPLSLLTALVLNCGLTGNCL